MKNPFKKKLQTDARRERLDELLHLAKFEDTIVEYKAPLPTVMLIGLWVFWIAVAIVTAMIITWIVVEVAGMIWGDEWVTYFIADLVS